MLETKLIVLMGVGVVFYLYKKTKQYNTYEGFLLFTIGIITLLMKFFLVKEKTFFFIPQTNNLSGYLTFLITAIGIFFLFLLSRKKKRKLHSHNISYFFGLYLVFGFTEQIFFQYIVLETVYSITKSVILSASMVSFFYAQFHPKKWWGFYHYGTMIVGFFWALIYLNFGNIVWLSLSHAVFGVCYYRWIYKGDILKKKLRYKAEDSE